MTSCCNSINCPAHLFHVCPPGGSIIQSSRQTINRLYLYYYILSDCCIRHFFREDKEYMHVSNVISSVKRVDDICRLMGFLICDYQCGFPFMLALWLGVIHMVTPGLIWPLYPLKCSPWQAMVLKSGERRMRFDWPPEFLPSACSLIGMCKFFRFAGQKIKHVRYESQGPVRQKINHTQRANSLN